MCLHACMYSCVYVCVFVRICVHIDTLYLISYIYVCTEAAHQRGELGSAADVSSHSVLPATPGPAAALKTSDTYSKELPHLVSSIVTK